ncbi:MAG: hypothetical protein M3N98_04720 [Actinomycetota bacterium]|nr:hypothetical protein [Actinomycetota bacterium]
MEENFRSLPPGTPTVELQSAADSATLTATMRAVDDLQPIGPIGVLPLPRRVA